MQVLPACPFLYVRTPLTVGGMYVVDINLTHTRGLQVDSIDVSHVKASALSNAGLLIASLTSNEGGDKTEIIDVNLVVTVARSGTDDAPVFTRTILNPLE